MAILKKGQMNRMNEQANGVCGDADALLNPSRAIE